jgi:hypothetical protein
MADHERGDRDEIMSESGRKICLYISAESNDSGADNLIQDQLADKLKACGIDLKDWFESEITRVPCYDSSRFRVYDTFNGAFIRCLRDILGSLPADFGSDCLFQAIRDSFECEKDWKKAKESFDYYDEYDPDPDKISASFARGRVRFPEDSTCTMLADIHAHDMKIPPILPNKQIQLARLMHKCPKGHMYATGLLLFVCDPNLCKEYLDKKDKQIEDEENEERNDVEEPSQALAFPSLRVTIKRTARSQLDSGFEQELPTDIIPDLQLNEDCWNDDSAFREALKQEIAGSEAVSMEKLTIMKITRGGRETTVAQLKQAAEKEKSLDLTVFIEQQVDSTLVVPNAGDVLPEYVEMVSEQQRLVAEAILRRAKYVLTDFENFKAVEFLVLMPTFNTIKSQTQQRIRKDVPGCEDWDTHKMDKTVFFFDKEKNLENFNAFKARCLKEENKHVLYLIIADECHWGACKDSAHDVFVNDAALNKQLNFMTLLVSATPYNNLSTCSRIPECYFKNDSGLIENVVKYDEKAANVEYEELHVVNWCKTGKTGSSILGVSPYVRLEWFLNTVRTNSDLRHNPLIIPSKQNPLPHYEHIRCDSSLHSGKKDLTMGDLLIDYAFSMVFFSVYTCKMEEADFRDVEKAERFINKISVIVEKFVEKEENLQIEQLRMEREKKLRMGKNVETESTKKTQPKEDLCKGLLSALTKRLNSLGSGTDHKYKWLTHLQGRKCEAGQSPWDMRVQLTESDIIIKDLLAREERGLHGHMKLIRVTKNAIGQFAAKFLRECRKKALDESFALQMSDEGTPIPPFAVVHEDGGSKGSDSSNGSLYIAFNQEKEIRQYFELKAVSDLGKSSIADRQMKLKNSKRPRTLQYSDLEGLPIILILVEKGRMGDTFPQSLDCLDLRVRASDNTSTFIQEIGRMCRYPRTIPYQNGRYRETAIRKSQMPLRNDEGKLLPQSLTFDGKVDTVVENMKDIFKKTGSYVAVFKHGKGPEGGQLANQVFVGYANHLHNWADADSDKIIPEVVFRGNQEGRLAQIHDEKSLSIDCMQDGQSKLGWRGCKLMLYSEEPTQVFVIERVDELSRLISLGGCIKNLKRGEFCRFAVIRDSSTLEALLMLCLDSEDSCKGSCHELEDTLPYALLPRSTVSAIGRLRKVRA